MSKRAIITGTLILTIANLITKFMGFFYRIFMSNTIGAEGMGLYQLILPIYILTWSITSAGFTTTISRLTAQENIRGQSGNIGRIVKQSIALSVLVSIIVSGCLFLLADEIALGILKDNRTALSLRLLSFAIPFMAAGSCFRGFFLGLQNAVIPALSQVLEQFIRILTIYLLAGIFVPMGLAYACCAAIAGVVLGEFLSFSFVAISYFHFKRRKKMIKRPTLSALASCSMILSMALPLSATRIIGSLLATTENILIPRQLQLYGQNAVEALSSYGELTGMAMPLILLPSACLVAASISLIPEISEACAVHQNERIRRTVSVTFLFTFIVGIGATALFAVFSREICYIVYNRQNLGEILFPLAFICPFLYAQTTLHGLLNGMGEQFFLFRSNMFASAITIGGIWFFMPLYGIPAFLVAWAGGMVFSVIACLHKLHSLTGVFPNLADCFIKPLLAGSASGLLIRYVIQISTPSKLLFVLSLIAMGLLYLVFLLFLGCFSKENITTFLSKKDRI
ncbi:MAG: oligosaccharide flippase family protein [Anaerotignum sp.]